MHITHDVKIYIGYERNTVHVRYNTSYGKLHYTLASGDVRVITIPNVLSAVSEGVEAAVAGAMVLEGKGGTDG